MSTVETQFGKVQGFKANGALAFPGIPFAAAPVGERRWRAPEDPASWPGVKQLEDFGAQAWQMVFENMGPLGFAFNAREASKRNEDCLNLNVWTPAADDGKRPVLVWIHGGGFTGGTGGTPIYDGTSLASRGDAVVVTINYRLGALGFLNLNEVTGGRIPAAGNEGLLDQVKALEWVRDNIAAFGGDPARVTIFGESAGGMSVGSLLGFKPAAGLFHRAIAQSGACSTAQPLERAVEVAQGLLDTLGISANAAADELVTVEPERLIMAGAAVSAQMGNAMVFLPCIDGELLTDLPIQAVQDGAADGIPVMVGATRDEWKLFGAMPGFEANHDDASLEAFLDERVSDPVRVMETYRTARRARGEPADANALFAAIETDRVFRVPAIRLAEALAARGQMAFQYLFTWDSPWEGGALGSPHAIDLGFVFGTHSYSEASAEFFGSGERSDALAVQVQDAWLKFAADGDPRTEPLAGWQPYDADRRATALLGDPLEVADDPYAEERKVWEDVDASLGGL